MGRPSGQPAVQNTNYTKKQKVIKTCWLFCAMILVGFTNGILGPTVLSLLAITHSSVQNIGGMFVGQGLGFTGGIIIGALVSTRNSPSLSLSLSLFMASITNAVLPWMRSYPAMAFFVLLQFFFKGMVYNCSMYINGLTWPKDNDVPFQFILVGLGLGAFISPFFAYLVLKTPDSDHAINPSNLTDSECLVLPETRFDNSTILPGHLANVCNKDVAIYVPYTLIAVLTLPAAFAFVYYAIKERDKPVVKAPEETYESLSDISEEQNPKKISPVLFWMVMFLMLIFHIPFGGILVSYSHLLSAFGIHSRLKLSAAKMAVMTSLYWFCCLFGRSTDTLLATRFPMFRIISSKFIGLVVAGIDLALFADVYEEALWLGSAMISFFNSVFLPGVMTWIGSYIPLGSIGISFSLVGLGLGEFITPIIGGYIFNTFGPMSLMYMTMILVSIQLAIFLTLIIIVHTQLK